MNEEIASWTNKLRTSENDFISLTSASNEKISSLEKQVIIIIFKFCSISLFIFNLIKIGEYKNSIDILTSNYNQCKEEFEKFRNESAQQVSNIFLLNKA